MMTGAEMKSWRKKNRYTQEMLCHELDVSRQTIMAWEKSAKVPRLTRLALIALEEEPACRIVDGERQTAAQHVEQRARAAHITA
jgi:DNA-binding XRE family transcriptional regulator